MALQTVKQFAQANREAQVYPDSERSVRHLILNAEHNGFAQVITRIGRRVLIDTEAFEQWVKTQKEVKAAA